MSDPILDLGIGLLSFVFGAGVAYATIKSQVRAARIEAATALAQAQDGLARVAVERERSTRQEGRLDLIDERIKNLQDGARKNSERAMAAVRQPTPPAMRARQGSLRREEEP